MMMYCTYSYQPDGHFNCQCCHQHQAERDGSCALKFNIIYGTVQHFSVFCIYVFCYFFALFSHLYLHDVQSYQNYSVLQYQYSQLISYKLSIHLYFATYRSKVIFLICVFPCISKLYEYNQLLPHVGDISLFLFPSSIYSISKFPVSNLSS